MGVDVSTAAILPTRFLSVLVSSWIYCAVIRFIGSLCHVGLVTPENCPSFRFFDVKSETLKRGVGRGANNTSL